MMRYEDHAKKILAMCVIAFSSLLALYNNNQAFIWLSDFVSWNWYFIWREDYLSQEEKPIVPTRSKWRDSI